MPAAAYWHGTSEFGEPALHSMKENGAGIATVAENSDTAESKPCSSGHSSAVPSGVAITAPTTEYSRLTVVCPFVGKVTTVKRSCSVCSVGVTG